jgi:hypothetical protein
MGAVGTGGGGCGSRGGCCGNGGDVKRPFHAAPKSVKTADPKMISSTAIAADISVVLTKIKQRRAVLTTRIVKSYVKMSGGWRKAFPDKEPVAPKFDLTSKEGAWCMDELRMLSGDIVILRKQLGIPNEFRCKNRDTCSGVDALCMLLYRLARPRRYRELRVAFGGSAARIGRLSNSLSVYLHNRFHRKLNSLDRGRLTDEYLIRMARAQFAKNGVMQNIVGFIDATVRPCCRYCLRTPSFSKFSPYFLVTGLFTFSRKFTTARIVSML